MDKVNKEYNRLVEKPPFLFKGRNNWTVRYGLSLHYDNYSRMLNFRYDTGSIKRGCSYKHIYKFGGFLVAELPKHYYHMVLVSELPYRANEIFFWIWALNHFLSIKELQLKIIYWAIL